MREKIQIFVASLLPRWLVYHAAIRLGVKATTGRYSATIVPDLTFMDALKRWEE